MYRLSLIISEIYNKYLPLAEKDGIILNLDFSDTTKEISDPERVKQYLDENLSSALKRSDKGEVTISVDKTAITVTDSGTTLSRSACALLSNRYIDVSSRVGFGTTVKIFLQPRELPATPAEPKAPLEVKGVAVSAGVDKTQAEPVAQGGVSIAAEKGKQKLGLRALLRLRGQKTTESTKSSTKSALTKTSSKPVRATSPAKTASAKKSAKKVSTKTTKLSKDLATTKPKSKSAKSIKPQTRRQLATAARKADREVKRITKKANKQKRVLSKQAQALAKQTERLAKKAQKSARAKAKSQAKAQTKVKAQTKSKTKTKRTKKKFELS